MSSPATKKIRRPLAELSMVSGAGTSTMSQGPQDNSIKRAAKDYDGAAPGSSSSQPLEKKRRASKRVSFGGEHVKLFDSNASMNYDDYNDNAEISSGGDHFAGPLDRSPKPYVLNGKSAINSFDDVGEDTLTLLPKYPRSSFPDSAAPLTAKNIVNKGHSHPSRYSLDPRKYDGFVDEDIERGYVPRFSIPGDETLTLHGKPSPEIDQSQSQEPTMSSEEDVTLQLPDMDALDVVAQPAHYELSARASTSQMRRHAFNPEYDGVDDYFADDVKSPFSADLRTSPTDLPKSSSMMSSGSKPPLKQHVPKATQSLPRTQPSPGKRMPRQSLPENRRLFSNDNEDEDTTIHFHDSQVQQPKRPPQPTSILKKTNYPQPLSLAQFNTDENNDPKSPGNLSRNRSESKITSTPQSNRKVMSTPQSVLGSKLRAVALQGSASKRQEDASITIEHSISLNPHNEYSNMQHKVERKEDVQKLTIENFLDAAGIHFKDSYSLARSMSSPGSSFSRGLEVAPREDRNTLSGQIVSCVTHEAVLNELQNANFSLSELTASVREQVSNIAEDIEKSPPPIFAKVSPSSNLSPEQISVIHTGLKRLRRVATMRSSLIWVTSRQTRERRIASLLKSSLQSLERDSERMVHDEAACMSYKDYLSSQISNLDLGSLSMNSTKFASAGERDKLVAGWRSLKADLSILQGYIDRRKEVLNKVQELKKQKEEYTLKLDEARKHLSTGSSSMLEGIIEKKKTLRELHSCLSRIIPMRICAAHLDIRVGNYADVRFYLSGDSVHEVEVQSLASVGVDLPSAISAFLTDAVSKCSRTCLKNVTNLSHIPLVLHLAREYLTNVKQTCRDVLQYQDEHEQDFELLQSGNSNSDSADLVIAPCYFHVQKRRKFEVTVSGHHLPPKFDATSLAFEPAVQSISVTSVCAIIGEAPSAKDVEDVLQSRSRGDNGCVSQQLRIRQKLEAIWDGLIQNS